MTAGGSEYRLMRSTPSKLHRSAAMITNNGPKAKSFFIKKSPFGDYNTHKQ
jgi:hypothetical protein